MHKRDWTLLFSEFDLRAILAAQIDKISDAVIAIPRSRFDGASDELLSAEIASSLVVAPIELHEDRIEVSTSDAKIDVSHDPLRSVWDRSRPAYVDGMVVTYHLPVSGDMTLFRCRPSAFNMNPPRAIIGSGELSFPYDSANRDVPATRTWLQQDLNSMRTWVPWVLEQVNAHNASIEAHVRGRVAQRRAELDKERQQVAELGFKVRSASPSPPVPSLVDTPVTRRKKSRTKARRQFDVALSFAGEDRPFVEKVAEALRRDGVEVFYDAFEQVSLWGNDLSEHLGEVYGKQSRFVVLFLSRYYAQKAWPNHEKRFALSGVQSGGVVRVLPVRFDDTEVAGLPPSISYLDLRVLTPDKLAELIRQKLDLDEPEA